MNFAPDGRCGGGGVSVGTSSHLDPAVLVVAEPDAGGHPLHLVLAAEGAGVLRVLRDLHLLHSLPQGGAVPRFSNDFWTLHRGFLPGAILSGDSDLLGALGHLKGCF